MSTRRQFLTRLVGAAGLLAFWRKGQAQELKVTLPKGFVTKPRSFPMERLQHRENVDFNALLWAIAERETGNNDRVIGPKGERSKYGITETVWRQVNHGPLFWLGNEFHRFCSGDIAEHTALLHLHWLHSQIPQQTMTEVYHREYALAWAWHGGLTGWLEQRHPKRCDEYAQSVANLYAERIKAV